MDFSIQFFIILLVAGLILIGAEVFVPGGVLGVIGGFALLGAIMSGFRAFGPSVGGYIAVGIIILMGVVIALWIKLFPKTKIGKTMTVSQDLSSFEGTQAGIKELVGKEGQAISDLRPGGFAVIAGHRVDVVTQGEMISKGESVRVIEVEANRVIVGKV